jgi:hypothetical protein
MKVPEEWAVRAAVVCVPWAHPEPEGRYATLLDAVIGIGSTEPTAAPWIILEDGRIVNPRQIARLYSLVHSGAFVGAPIL